MATSQQIETIAKRVLPDLSPHNAAEQTNLLLARVMAAGNWEETNMVMEHFGEPAMRAVLDNPPIKIFDRESWNHWHLVFELPKSAMRDSFFTIYPWFRNRTLGIREPATAEVLDRQVDYNTTPVYSCDEQ
jgi:hypothetical protein